MRNSNEFANLDLLRAVAVCLVFADHLAQTMKVRGLGALGHFGVLLFFVHTSFVLMLSMERLGLSGRELYIAFAVRRVFRIYPLSVLAVLCVVVFQIPSTSWLGDYAWRGWSAFVSNILLVQNVTRSGSVLSVLWSLPFEVQMYATLPAIYLLMRRYPSLWAARFTWLAGVAVAGAEYVVRGDDFDSAFLLTRYFPCFLAGILAWRTFATRRERLPGALWILALAVLIAAYRAVDAFRVYGPGLLAALHGTLRNDHRVFWPPYLDLVNDWVFCGLTGLAIPLFADLKTRWLNVVSREIAKYSYGIYVCHVPVLWICFVKLHISSFMLSTILSLFLIGAISIFLYHLVEDPGIRLGKRLAMRLERSNAVA